LTDGGDRATPDCGAEVVTRQYDGLFLLLDGDRFVGWVTGTPGLTTGDGIGVGATLADLRAAYPDLTVTEGSVGAEWSSGDDDLSGFLDGTADSSPVLYERTGSTTVLALAAASRWIPAVLVSAYASVLADRYERTRVMRASAAASAGVMALLAVEVALDVPVPLLIATSVLTALTAAPYNPASQALIPETVGEKDLAAANGLFGALENLVVVIGPLVGGAILLVASPAVGMVVNAGTLLVAIALLSLLDVRSTGSAAADGDGAWEQWLVGVRTLAQHRVAVVLVLFCALDSAVYGAPVA